MTLLTRIEAASLLGVSSHTLARAATDAEFGGRAEKNGLLPPLAGYGGNGAALYDEAAVRAALASREVAALAGRLRAVKKPRL